MKIKEVIALQTTQNNRTLYLIQVGLFYHAYDMAACYLHEVTGYQMKWTVNERQHVLKLGFPTKSWPKVMTLLTEKGAVIEDNGATGEEQGLISIRPPHILDINSFKDIPEIPRPEELTTYRKNSKETASKEKEDMTAGISSDNPEKTLQELIRNYPIDRVTPMHAYNFLYYIKQNYAL